MYGIQIYDKASVEAVLNFWPNSRLAVLVEEVLIKKCVLRLRICLKQKLSKHHLSIKYQLSLRLANSQIN